MPKILFDPKIETYFTYKDKLENLSDYIVCDEEWSNYFNYIKVNRINLNIRQVN